MTRRLLPQFIIEKFAAGITGGSFAAASLFVDISGFTAASDALMKQGQEGGERLADIMDATFAPLVASVYNCGGFVTGFAGDAFTALFPENDDKMPAILRALAAAQQMQAAPQPAAAGTQPAPSNTFTFAIKLGLAAGNVDWGILAPQAPDFEQEPTVGYYFTGSAVQDSGTAENLAKPGELVVSQAIWQAIEPFCEGDPIAGFVRVTQFSPLSLPTTTDPPPLPSEQDLMPFVPASVRDLRGRGEFRDITTLFIDFKDRSAGAAFSQFVQTVFRLQKLYGGYLNTIHFGDKGSNLLLFWGMPTSFENDVERALQFATHLARLAPGLFRAGITCRPMFAGFVGTSERQEYSCYGRGINLAARLMSQAAWGEIWLDEESAQQGQAQYQLRPMGRYTFKGFTQVQPAHLLLGQRVSSATAPYQGHLVGRQADLAQLANFLGPLALGQPAGLLVVWGEAGIGKSRLIHTLRAHQQSDGSAPTPALFKLPFPHQWLICPADQIRRAALNPFRQWLRHYFEQIESVEPAVNQAAFAARWDALLTDLDDADLAAELERTRPFLEELLHLPGAVNWTRQLDARTRFENTLAALQSLLLAESRRQPIILFLEDADWLDEESTMLINRLLNDPRPAPLAIVAATRQDDQAWLKTIDTAYQTLHLGRLSATELKKLCTEVLGMPVTNDLVQLLVEQADGNPFFAEQILLHLRDHALLQPMANGQLGLVNRPDLALTLDLRALLVARLDRLSQPVKEVVQTAAVLGREFDVHILTQMMGKGADIADHVQAAERAAIWRQQSEASYSFHHALLRDAAYSMQLRARRRQLHAQAALTLETIFAPNLADSYDELAYHYERAEQLPQARHYLAKAATAAAAAYQNQPALDYCRRLLATFPDGGPDSREDGAIYAQAQRTRADVFRLIGDWPAAEAAYRAALKLTERLDLPDEAAAIRSDMGELMRLKGHYDTALVYHQQALAHFQYLGDTAAAARVLGNMGLVYARRGDYEHALDCYNQVLHFARAHDDKDNAARMHNNIAIVRKNQGDLQTAAVELDLALALYQALDDLQGVQMALGNLANVQKSLGDLPAAQATFQAGLEQARKLGDKRSIALFYGNLGNLYSQLDDLSAARQHFEDALALERELGNREGVARNLSNLGQLHLRQGEYAAALDYLERTLPMIRQLNAQYPLAETLVHQAAALLGLNRPAQAQLSNDEAVQIADTIGARRLAFTGQLQAARIQAACRQPGVVDRLEWLLAQYNELAEQAQIYFELWQLTQEKAYAEAALARYRQLSQGQEAAAAVDRYQLLKATLSETGAGVNLNSP